MGGHEGGEQVVEEYPQQLTLPSLQDGWTTLERGSSPQRQDFTGDCGVYMLANAHILAQMPTEVVTAAILAQIQSRRPHIPRLIIIPRIKFAAQLLSVCGA